jgi:hypothetical protein
MPSGEEELKELQSNKVTTFSLRLFNFLTFVTFYLSSRAIALDEREC